MPKSKKNADEKPDSDGNCSPVRNPQIPKGEGDEPVQAYIAAMPGWKRSLGERLNELIGEFEDVGTVDGLGSSNRCARRASYRTPPRRPHRPVVDRSRLWR